MNHLNFYQLPSLNKDCKDLNDFFKDHLEFNNINLHLN